MRLLLIPPVLMATVSLPVHAQAPMTKAPEIKWEGEWGLLAEESDSLEARIEEHLKGQNFAMKLLWKRKLQNACRTYVSMDILLGAVFSVTLGREVPADAATDGTTSEWKRSDGEKFNVSMTREDSRITEVFAGDGYTLTYAYSLPKADDTLVLRITYASPKLNNPFSYKLVYKKRS